MRDDPERLDLLRTIRIREAALAAKYLPQTGRLLEVGAGTGYQARYFEQLGLRVDAIDVQGTRRLERDVFPVQIYDGRHIPFPDETFDVVHTSHVLEHVRWCAELLAEMRRVLKDRGLMLHTLPTPSWRIWTILAHYPWALSRLISRGKAMGRSCHASLEYKGNTSFLRLLQAGVLPSRHGVRGNWLTEVYYFSRMHWERTFEAARLRVQVIESNRLFYTGYGIPGPSFPMEARVRLAQWLGSSSMLFVLQKAHASR